MMCFPLLCFPAGQVLPGGLSCLHLAGHPHTPTSPHPLPCPTPVCPQVKFYQVSEPELEDLRERFASGRFDISIEHSQHDMTEYNAMEKRLAPEVAEIKVRPVSWARVDGPRMLIAPWSATGGHKVAAR